jgi:hypothetical protein
MFEWVIVYYPIPIAVAVFMAITGLLMVAFLMYHGLLISQGRTTYETFKRDQLYKDMREAVAAVAAQAQNLQDDQHAGSAEELRVPDKPCTKACAAARAVTSVLLARVHGLMLRRQQLQAPAVHMPPNLYDRGLLGNWLEVLFPQHFLRQHGDRTCRASAWNASSDSISNHVETNRILVMPDCDVSIKKMH